MLPQIKSFPMNRWKTETATGTAVLFRTETINQLAFWMGIFAGFLTLVIVNWIPSGFGLLVGQFKHGALGKRDMHLAFSQHFIEQTIKWKHFAAAIAPHSNMWALAFHFF